MTVQAGELASVFDERSPGQLLLERSLEHRIRIDLLEDFVERPFGNPGSDARCGELLTHAQTAAPAGRFASGDGARGPRIVYLAGLPQLREGGVDLTRLVGPPGQARAKLRFRKLAPGEHGDGILVGGGRHDPV